uniref:Uncharacterized protein n=1 Tax=Avena sativa TaxID=4498 RepID=A0ACD5XZY3_AVESA
MDTAGSFALFLLTSIKCLWCISALDFLSPGSFLSVERSSDVLYSPDGTFTCGFYQVSPNSSVFSIWFSNSSEKTVVWSANPLHPVYTWGSKFVFNPDGTMVLKDYNSHVVWTSNVSPSSTPRHARLLNSGNLIVKGTGDFILWESFASPTHTLLPGQSINATMKLVSANRLLIPGHYNFHFDDQYLLSLFDDEKGLSFIYWPNPSHTIWDKLRVPFNSTTSGVLDSFGHFLASDNATFTAADWGPGIQRRLTLDFDGNLRLYSLDKGGRTWSVTWLAFPQLCKVRGLCGRNGICVYTPVPSCVCVPGFEVVDPSDWTKGCNPKINITCDDDQKVRFLRLPNTDFFGYDAGAYHFVSLRTCENLCLNDCNCMGFAYWQGLGDCYPKSALVGGVTLTNLGSTGTMYIKIPEGMQVSMSSIPHSQPLGPKYSLNCSATNKYFIAHFLDELQTGHNNESKHLYLYGFLSAVFLAELLFIVFGWFILRKEGRQLRGVWPAEVGYEMITNHFRRYNYMELVTATRRFQDELGRGASGIVYKGVLKDKREIAVKKLANVYQCEEEFQHELDVIGRIYHMHLVRVWGFCSDGPHRMLVSEFVKNGSLDKMLFGGGSSRVLLEWKQRFDIALGVAKGLAYLHHECSEWVIHCDMKPENILLDENLEPKIADFGLAKLLNRGGSNTSVSRIRGTRGYLAPEWVSNLPVTSKVDVYSFGVVLLELLKGARVSDLDKNVDDEEVEMVLKRTVNMLMEMLELDISEQYLVNNFIDTRLNGHLNNLQARTMMKLAVSCLQEDRGRRPTMEKVVQMLASVDE